MKSNVDHSYDNRIAQKKWVVMLCGGSGSRMGSLTKTCPKSMLLVLGKPIIWYSFLGLINNGFGNFILPLGFLGSKIQSYITDVAKHFDCNVMFVDTGENTPIASRINQVKHLIPEKQDFFLLNSDTLFDFDIEAMRRHHLAKQALVTLSSVEVVSPWGVLTVDGDNIISFDRDRKVQRLISSSTKDGYGVVNSGFAWINKSALDLIDFDNVVDFETDLFSAVIKENRITHFVLEGVWIPIDTPKDLAAVNYTLESNSLPQNLIGSLANKFLTLKRDDE